jgi:transposase
MHSEEEWQQLQNLLRQQQALIETQQQQILALQKTIESLQDQLSKTSRNSHLPPSSDRFARQPKSLRKSSGKKPGGQAGHEGNTLYVQAEPDSVVHHRVIECQHCQQNLCEQAPLALVRRQVVDLPPKRVLVIEHQCESKLCPACHQVSCAPFPEGVNAPVQYGPAFAAVAVYLVHQHFLPYERACELLHDVLGQSMSTGALQALVQRCATHLLPVEEQIKAALRAADVLHQDETGCYVMGQRQWVHVSATASLTHYACHPKRGSEALDAIGILPSFQGVSVHDGWKSYQRYDCSHALCNVHHLRELTFLAEQHQQRWARELKELLVSMKAHVDQARAAGYSCLDPPVFEQLLKQYHDLLRQGYEANPPEPAPTEKKPGKAKQSTARNLLDRLSTQQEAVLRFLSDFDVPFDNSQAERDIRMVKVQQKVSGCFRSLLGVQAFCRIRGYLSTLRKQGMNALTALELAYAGHPVLPSF